MHKFAQNVYRCNDEVGFDDTSLQVCYPISRAVVNRKGARERLRIHSLGVRV